MNSFENLFRSSGFASLQHSQVVGKPAAARQGYSQEWGLKFSIPTATKVLHIAKMEDELLKRPIVRTAIDRVGYVEQWKEQFAPPQDNTQIRSQAARVFQHRSQLPMKPLARMNRKEWKLWIDEAYNKREKFQKDLQSRVKRQSQWKQTLDLHLLPKETHSIHPVHYSTLHQLSTALNTTQRSKSSSKLEAELKFCRIRGRLLNVVKMSDMAVGINGIVAYMHHSKISNNLRPMLANTVQRTETANRNPMFEFWVVKAEHDHLKRPDVVVSLVKPLSSIGSRVGAVMGSFGNRRQTYATPFNDIDTQNHSHDSSTTNSVFEELISSISKK